MFKYANIKTYLLDRPCAPTEGTRGKADEVNKPRLIRIHKKAIHAYNNGIENLCEDSYTFMHTSP